MTPVFLTPKNPHFLFPQLSPKKGWFPYASNLTKPLQKVFHLIQYQICPKSVSQSAWLNSNETIARIHEEKVEVSSSYRNRAVFLHLHAINRESGQSFADVLENQSSLCTATVLQMLQWFTFHDKTQMQWWNLKKKKKHLFIKVISYLWNIRYPKKYTKPSFPNQVFKVFGSSRKKINWLDLFSLINIWSSC